ncbi:MAG TPA: GGDEF domain-containing protein [Acidimicrobiales bacterium]|jgi:diguanylate cyclase (GGDEF)-like protein|nr:GGDEF domain-containing protein [Acidimicrobiales bacterium]
MNEAVSPFEEPWPDDEMQLVADAVRAAVAAPRPVTTDAPTNGADGPTGKFASSEAVESALVEAGHRWARAHQSASLMRSRLDALETSMDSEVDAGSDADRAAYHRAWRTVIDAATWTSLNQLEEAALLDPLTGVGNRRALDLMLTRAMSGARRSGSELVVVAIDLDGLKRINDSRGHAEGDRTLTSLVDAVGEGLRTSDTVFRTGGDEFAVVLQGIGLGEVEPLMHRISTAGTPQFTWGAASLAPEHQQPSELLDAADTDLYRRRGVDRALVGAGAVTLATAGAGAVVDLRRPKGSITSRVSRRASVAVAAGLVAIGGTLAAVTTLSPGIQTALPPKHHTTTPSTAGGGGGTPNGGTKPSTSTSSSNSTGPFTVAPIAHSGTSGANIVGNGNSTTIGTTSTTIPGPTSSSTTTPTTAPPGPTGTTPPTSPTGAVSGLVLGLETTVNSTVFGLVGALGLGGLVAAPKN